MKKGFLAFALGAVFLLALVSSGVFFSSAKHGTSFQRYQLLQLQEVSAKNAFYASIADAARQKAAEIAAASALGMETHDPRQEIRQAMHARAMEFESQLVSQGYSISFWCSPGGAAGSAVPATEESRQAASLEMERTASAVPLSSASPLALCADSFDVDVRLAKIHLNGMGFSLYSKEAGLGTAAVLPSSYEIGFGEGLE